MPFELSVGLRYITAGRWARSTRFISFISLMSTVGIALGVAALIMVLSVMNGFQTQVRDRMLGVLSHLELVTSDSSEASIALAQQALLKTEGVVATAPSTRGQAMAVRGDRLQGVLVRGVDPAQEPGVSEGLSTLRAGDLSRLSQQRFGAVVGSELANNMGIAMGDPITLVTAEPSAGLTGILPRMKQFEVVGIFSSGHYEYDSGMVFVSQGDAQAFFRDQGMTGVRARLANLHEAPWVSALLSTQLPPTIQVRDWTRENSAWFAAVQLEKRMMFVILVLIIAVAAFNLVSMLVMTVMDKRSDIAILKTLGAQPHSILSIFMIQGAALGLLGVVSGTILGSLGAWQIDALVAGLESLMGFQLLPKGIYLIESLPSDLRLLDVLQISLTAMLLSFLATLYPSWQASRVQPAEALRHD
jgi:lipoprotein-releasing system permease protein